VFSERTERPTADQKQRAIDIHDEQAALFRSRYERLQRDPYSSAFTYGRKKVDAVLDRYLPAGGDGRRLLDAGCGSGHALLTYIRRGFDGVGLDAAAGMVERARALDPTLDVRLGDVEQLPFADESFDHLLSIEVIRYLADPRRALREFRRVLRPGGLALVTAMPPLTLTGYSVINHLTSRRQIRGFSRVRQFFHSVGTLESMFRECGFDTVEVTAVFWGPFVNLERLAPQTLPRLLRAWEPWDDRLSHLSGLRNFSNHLVVAARRLRVEG
jgi:ubiquinone/menaquinone biosynthesis C-methylase UbiE